MIQGVAPFIVHSDTNPNPSPCPCPVEMVVDKLPGDGKKEVLVLVLLLLLLTEAVDVVEIVVVLVEEERVDCVVDKGPLKTESVLRFCCGFLLLLSVLLVLLLFRGEIFSTGVAASSD